jgi:hypothetical protein
MIPNFRIQCSSPMLDIVVVPWLRNPQVFSHHMTSILLVPLHTFGGSLRCGYSLYDTLNSFQSRVVSLKDFLAQSMGILCLLNQSISRMTSMPFESKIIRLAIKSTPPYFKIQHNAYCLPDISLRRSLTSIQKKTLGLLSIFGVTWSTLPLIFSCLSRLW